MNTGVVTRPTTKRLAAAATAAMLACAAFAPEGLLRAQANQPIYPAYDGYVKNPDGSYTLAFGYFNHNRNTVSVSVGADNTFGSAQADRQQPITFLPGQHRFQCFVVMGADFDGKLRWTLNYAGTSTTTSEKMLQYSWELVEGADMARAIDYAKAPKGVCLNRAPVVSVLGQSRQSRGLTVALSDQAQLFGNVEDEGLPRNAALSITWREVSGPAPITFANPHAARTTASFTAAGRYELELSATDSVLTSSTRLAVTVTTK